MVFFGNYKWRSLFCFVALCLFPSFAQAETLYDLATLYPRTLISDGISQLGDLSLPKLLEDLKQVKAVLVSSEIPAGSGDLRAGMVNLASQKEIVISTLMYNQAKPLVRQIWLLHEHLEAIGYNDEEYELSLSFWWISNLPGSEQKDYLQSPLMSFFKNLQPSDKDRTYLLAKSGGVTGVGSGGDPYSIQGKIDLMNAAKDFQQSYAQAHPGNAVGLSDLYQRILSLDVETNYDTNPYKTIPDFTNNSVSYPFMDALTPVYGAPAAEKILTKLMEKNP